MFKTPEVSNDNIFSDTMYTVKAAKLITEALKDGSDVMQLENGDIVINQTKRITLGYRWSEKKRAFKRILDGN